MQTGPTYAFGPFELDGDARRLTRDGDSVALSDRQIEILRLLTSRAGEVLSKDTLIEAAWKDVAVSDNSLEQAISSLRRTLGSAPDGSQYIETLARRGYRFNAAVTRSVARHSDVALEGLIAPYVAFVEGRAALETLEPTAVARACEVFTDVVAAAPDYAPGHLAARGESRSYEGSTQSIRRTTLTRMAMGTRETDQPPLWIATSDLPTSPGHPFYARLTTLLDGHHFDRFVEGLCRPVLRARDGPTELGTRALLPPAAGRLLRRHRLGTRDCVARAGLVGGPQLSAVGRGRGATRSFDDCAHAALDRSGDAPDRLYVGATTTRRGVAG